jgi:hypothetical protein
MKVQLDTSMLDAIEEALHAARAAAWDEGWLAGNDYAIAEPWDNATARFKNPYAQSIQK